MSLSFVGVVLASYLTWVHFDTGSLVCGLGDCHTVQASEFATIGPIPVAVLGLAMYATVLACNLVIRSKPESELPATIVAFAVALCGSVYALYLTWIEVAVIDAICQWCVVSAGLTLLLTVVQAMLLRSRFSVTEPVLGETGASDAAY
jgi:uncharacterized membrane protein